MVPVFISSRCALHGMVSSKSDISSQCMRSQITQPRSLACTHKLCADIPLSNIHLSICANHWLPCTPRATSAQIMQPMHNLVCHNHGMLYRSMSDAMHFRDTCFIPNTMHTPVGKIKTCNYTIYTLEYLLSYLVLTTFLHALMRCVLDHLRGRWDGHTFPVTRVIGYFRPRRSQRAELWTVYFHSSAT